MSLPDRNNPYSFEAFLNQLHGFDFYADDPFLQKVLKYFATEEFVELDRKLREFSPRVSFRWRPLTDTGGNPRKLPYMEHYNAYNRRIDRIVRTAETLQLEKEIFNEGLFSAKVTSWERMAKRYLLHQLGEFGVMCPIACTEGLVALIKQFPEDHTPEVKAILDHCTEGLNNEFGIGAQFVSEIQGGSDIPSNLLEAVPEGNCYRLYGTKFFTSAIHADYAVVTAKVSGSEDVGTFVVPAWMPGDKEKEIRNNFRINRIKWKMGTAEVPTAELEYDGTLCYAVGPTNRGVANAVGIVLTLSRIAVGIASAAGMTRAAREAQLYAEFRDVFGAKIGEWALANKQVRDLVQEAQRCLAGVCKIFALFKELGGRLQPGLASDEPLEMRRRRFLLRELIIIQKLVTAYDSVDILRKAISIFGGHGVIEDFCSLARIFRDAVVNELWEGPRNVLLMQVFRDMGRAAEFYSPDQFLDDLLSGAPQTEIAELGRRALEFAAKPPFQELDKDSRRRAAAWEEFIVDVFRVYQETALREVGPEPIIGSGKMRMPEIWR
ncbi:MAG: acyl-CoA dehydrogenase family protein [Deltaproteobacteria bacterium]|nr:MAG: acyl-CoA dehydrogenase family protein [Deltaproteobacteria bacterium]